MSTAKSVSVKKATGATYTPPALAAFVSSRILSNISDSRDEKSLRILDPAVGDGELLIALLERLDFSKYISVEVCAYDTDILALAIAKQRLSQLFGSVRFEFLNEDFLESAAISFSTHIQGGLFEEESSKFDIVISNPPYVRTQVLGAEKAQLLSETFGLRGRVDLYYAFIKAITGVLSRVGTLGIITSNRFMSTKSGESCREWYREHFYLKEIYDFGDTKLFDDAVLPAVVVAIKSSSGEEGRPTFKSVYLANESDSATKSDDLFSALVQSNESEDIVVGDQSYRLLCGFLENISDSSKDVWSISNKQIETWLGQVSSNTYRYFGDVGKIRVGVKTTADSVFIKRDWEDQNVIPEQELLRDLITHKQSRKWLGNYDCCPKILYTHLIVDGKKVPIKLDDFPLAGEYLETHREKLESRKYVTSAGRNWYEIWVPQNPQDWNQPKVVFRDIAEKSYFFLDTSSRIVNGDCYWIKLDNEGNEDWLWLICAIGNSDFVHEYYDNKFNNKLYSQKRRFMTQYVEKFPLPSLSDPMAKKLVELAKTCSSMVGRNEEGLVGIEDDMNSLVYKIFGVSQKN